MEGVRKRGGSPRGEKNMMKLSVVEMRGCIGGLAKKLIVAKKLVKP